VAERLKSELGIDAELVEGSRGEFTVWVGERKVAEKGWIRFPSDVKVLAAVREALAS
jgi:hypothetical protein